MEDEQIVELLFRRDQEALGELDRKYGAALRALTGRILGDAQDAEECVNDAYLGVWNAIPPARPQPLGPYVCKIARNIALRRYGRRAEERRHTVYAAAMEELAPWLPGPDTAETGMEARELARLLAAFLDGLTAENRVIFLRRYVFADRYGEIARRTGLTEGAVSVRLTRMRKALKRYLSERMGAE